MTGRRRFWVVNGTLAVVVATVALLGANTVFHKASAHATVRTVTASLGNVEATVSASGNVAPDQTENVSFATGGSVTAVDVALGQRVGANQVLGKLDPGPAQASLTAAQDNLTAAQDNLALAQSGGETPPQQAQDAATISSANQQISTAQSALATAEQQLATDQATCAASKTTTVTTADPPRSTSSSGSVGGTSGTGQSGAGQSATGSTSTGSTSTGSTSTGSSANTGSTSTGSSANTGCSAVTGDQQAVTQDQNAITQGQESLTQDQLSIEAKRYVNPATILQDQAAVTQAQATVIQDQKVLSETTLTAPFAGTVTALNGAVGQTVTGSGNSAASSSSSSSSTGSAASTAGSGSTGAASAGSAGSSASGSSASTSSGSSSAFLTLSNMSNLEIVAGFAEADATKINTGQDATVTLSALTGTSIPAKVTAVSPVSTVVSNVVTYAVTVGLTDPPSDVKPGMTANVSVVVASANNVLELPTSAITSAGRLSTVTVLKNGKQTTQTVTTGLAGDTETQIASGLSAGDVVVEPSVTVSGTGHRNRNRDGDGYGDRRAGWRPVRRRRRRFGGGAGLTRGG